MLIYQDELIEFIERSERHQNLSTLVDDFSHVIDRQGFNAFVMTGLPLAGPDVGPLVIANYWPQEWTHRYLAKVYFQDDPVSVWSMEQRRPFHWRDAWNALPKTDRVKQINGEASEFGLVDGIAFPLKSALRSSAVISLASRQRLQIGKGSEGLLFAAVAYFQMAANDIVAKSAPQPKHLTKREREILSWRGAGKSSWEISEILGISQATVKNHMKAVLRKLDVATTTQALVSAIRMGALHV